MDPDTQQLEQKPSWIFRGLLAFGAGWLAQWMGLSLPQIATFLVATLPCYFLVRFVFRRTHEITLAKRHLVLLAASTIGLTYLAFRLYGIAAGATHPLLAFAIWPVIISIGILFSAVILLPLSMTIFSRGFREAAKLEYYAENHQWEKTRRQIPIVLQHCEGVEHLAEFRLDAYEYTGSLEAAAGNHDAAIEAWEQALDYAGETLKSEKEIRNIGRILAPAYEKAGRWESLRQLIPRLEAAWESAPYGKKRALRELKAQRARIPAGFASLDNTPSEAERRTVTPSTL